MENLEELTDSFEAGNIDPSAFGHSDHVVVAYCVLGRYDFLDASVKYARCINSIATKAGATDKFNLTVTLAFLSLIAERIEATEHETYEGFIAGNPDLLSGKILDKWYSSDRLQSELARKVFLMPDVLAA